MVFNMFQIITPIFIYIVLVESFSSGIIDNDIVMITNETHTYCVSEKNVDNPIFIRPPRSKIQDTLNLITSEFWKDDDWKIKNSTDLVLDRRWNDFPLDTHTTHKSFLSPKSVSFSIFGHENFTIYIEDYEDVDYIMVNTEKNDDWNNFLIYTENGNTYLKQNDNIFYSTKIMEPTQIAIKSEKEMHSKVHEYKYVEATRPNENITYLTIPPIGKSLLIFYALLCTSCSLKITVNNKTHSIHSSTKKNLIPSEWQSYHFNINPNVETQIQIIRNVSRTQHKPFWVLDARLYDSGINKVAYEGNFTSETKYNCFYLKSQKIENNNQRKDISTDFSKNCPLGKLGQDCNLNCESVLGESFSKCEKHRICLATVCFCAWGFTGSFCNESCKCGNWGTNCDLKCPSECSMTCDRITGKCTKNLFHVFCDANKIIVRNWTDPNCRSHFSFEYECFQNSGSLNEISNRTQTTFNQTCVHYTFKLTDLDDPTNTTYVKMSGVCNTNNNPWSTITVYVLVLLIAVVLLAVFIYFFYKKRNKYHHIYEKDREEDIHLTPITYQNECTSIDAMFFNNYVLNLKDSTLKNQFDSFSESRRLGHTVAASRPQNIDKNRDRNRIVPYDHNRVILKPMTGVGQEDYINASYIDGYDRKKAYIACQGPKYHTVRDFWRMIWQHRVETIVMASELVENEQRICAEYWPQRINGVFECGKIFIKLISESNYEFYICRKFQIYYDSNMREVLQFHLKWNLINSEIFYPNNALPVVKCVREIYRKSSRPIVVHSRYGTNRAAIFILCDIALQMMETEKKIDMYSLTKQRTEQRPFFLNNVTYYLLVHLIVSEYLLEKKNPFENSKSAINEQLEYLQLLCQHDMMIQKYIPTIVKKNFLHVLRITRYGNKKKYFITKVPTEEEFVEFWKVIAAEEISSIIFLNQKLPLKTYKNVSSAEVIEVRRLEVKEIVHCTQTRISLFIYAKPSNQIICDSQINIFEFKDWNHRKQLPKSREAFIRMLNEVHRFEPEEDHILVGCSDGFTASGLFVVLSYILEKYEKELDVDICSAIRVARRSGKKFINKTQLNFAYSCINEYIQNHEKYQVIQEP